LQPYSTTGTSIYGGNDVGNGQYLNAKSGGFPGEDIFRHNIYLGFYHADRQYNESNYLVKDNLVMRDDGAKLSPSNLTVQNNTFLRNAVGIEACCAPGTNIHDNVFVDGNNYFSGRPAGDDRTIQEGQGMT